MKLKAFLFLGVIVTISACASIIKPTRVRVYNYDSAWRNALSAISDLGLTIQDSSKDSGTITTQWTGDFHSNVSGPGGSGYTDCRYLINITTVSGQVRLQCRFIDPISGNRKVLAPKDTYGNKTEQAHVTQIARAMQKAQ